MSAPANVISFYAEAHWGSLYGVIDAFHQTHHKGLDCGLFHGVVEVPALHGGTVVAVRASTLVGHYVTVQRADKLFDTYCHMVPAVTVGEQVNQGAHLGRQAVTQGEGGLQWKGQHTHLSLSDTIGGWGTWGAHNLDPTPGVIAVLTGTAGDASSPLLNGAVMDISVYARPSGMSYSVGWNKVKHNGTGAERDAVAKATGGVIQVSDSEFAYVLFGTGNAHLVKAKADGTFDLSVLDKGSGQIFPPNPALASGSGSGASAAEIAAQVERLIEANLADVKADVDAAAARLQANLPAAVLAELKSKL